MVFGRGWRRWPAGGFWPRAALKAASGCRHDTAVSRPALIVGRELETLKSRADFLRVARVGRRSAEPGLVVQAAPHPGGPQAPPRMRVGFTASRKVGNAVIRNRSKRRMRAAAASVLPLHGRPGVDYVLVARASTASRVFSELVADLETALHRVGRGGARRRATAETEA